MDIRKLSELVSVAGQISPADVSAIAASGFKTIVANRPDGEVEGQPTIEDIQHAAHGAGLTVIFQPVSPRFVADQDVADFSRALENAQTPVLAYCRTGTRCTILWALSEGAKGRPSEQIISAAAQAGYDMSGLAERIDAMARG